MNSSSQRSTDAQDHASLQRRQVSKVAAQVAHKLRLCWAGRQTKNKNQHRYS